MATWLEHSSEEFSTILDLKSFDSQLTSFQNPPRTALEEITQNELRQYAKSYFNGNYAEMLDWVKGETTASYFNRKFIESKMPANVWEEALKELKIFGISSSPMISEFLKDIHKDKKTEAMLEVLKLNETQILMKLEHVNKPIQKICNFLRVKSASKICEYTMGENHTFYRSLTALGWMMDSQKDIKHILK